MVFKWSGNTLHWLLKLRCCENLILGVSLWPSDQGLLTVPRSYFKSTGDHAYEVEAHKLDLHLTQLFVLNHCVKVIIVVISATSSVHEHSYFLEMKLTCCSMKVATIIRALPLMGYCFVFFVLHIQFTCSGFLESQFYIIKIQFIVVSSFL